MRKYSLFPLLFLTTTLFSQGISPAQQRKLVQALSAISSLYVDTINDTKLVESSIRGVLKDLDPHSVYTPKDEVQRMREPLEGSFEGIGVQFQILNDTIMVVQTIAGTPAEKVGVLPGDKIVYINNELIAGTTSKVQNSDVFKRLRGKKGTEVLVKIKRGSLPELIEFKIIRDKIPIYSVDATYMADSKTGYIKINSFGSTTFDEFTKALENLKKDGMKDLVLSLQGNGGGFLGTAIQIADEFLPAKKMIVYTQGNNQPRTDATATVNGNFEKGRLVVLVDEFSASASEIVSGALQDWDRAVIVGVRTFGKGLVQRELPLVDGSMMRLTVARYYTPTGRSIQRPYKDGTESYYKELYNRYRNGELMHADSIHFPDTLIYKTLITGRTVYGGGGIMPDIFVPVDTTEYSDLHRSMVAKGVVSRTAVEYLNKHREELKEKYTSFPKFKNQFETSDDFLKLLLAEAEKEKIKYDDVQFNRSKRLIKLQLKALIARDLWNINEYYQVMDSENESLQKALEILNTPGSYDKILTSSKLYSQQK